jgi:hypothetical protein
MIIWIITVSLFVIVGGALVIVEICDDRAWRRYNRQRDERIRRFIRDIRY